MIFPNLGFLLGEVGCSACAAGCVRTEGAGACKEPGPQGTVAGGHPWAKRGLAGSQPPAATDVMMPFLPPWTAPHVPARASGGADGPEPGELPLPPRTCAGAASAFPLPGPGAPVPLLTPLQSLPVRTTCSRFHCLLPGAHLWVAQDRAQVPLFPR